MGRGALSKDENDQVRTLARGVIERSFGGNIVDFAHAIGVSHSLVYEFLGGTRGAGTKLIRAIGAVEPEVFRVSGFVLDDGDDATPTVGNLTGYPEAERQARAATRYEDWLWRFVRRQRNLAPAGGAPVTVEWLLELAAFLNRNAADRAKAEHDTAKIVASGKALRTRKANEFKRRAAKE